MEKLMFDFNHILGAAFALFVFLMFAINMGGALWELVKDSFLDRD
jgi:hypothetical protein